VSARGFSWATFVLLCGSCAAREALNADESDRISAVIREQASSPCRPVELAEPVAMGTAPPLADGAGRDANYRVTSPAESRLLRVRAKTSRRAGAKVSTSGWP
jgi:hypothetical protein